MNRLIYDVFRVEVRKFCFVIALYLSPAVPLLLCCHGLRHNILCTRTTLRLPPKHLLADMLLLTLVWMKRYDWRLRLLLGTSCHRIGRADVQPL